MDSVGEGVWVYVVWVDGVWAEGVGGVVWVDGVWVEGCGRRVWEKRCGCVWMEGCLGGWGVGGGCWRKRKTATTKMPENA